MDDADALLVQAWKLAFDDVTDTGRVQLETLLPTLIAAGYVESYEEIWNFSPAGVARVNELLPD